MPDASHDAAPSRRATFQDTIALPEDLVGEVLDRALFTKPRPAPKQSLAGFSPLDEVVEPFQRSCVGPGGWIFTVGPELHLGERVIATDHAAWRRERLSRSPSGVDVDEASSDRLCEILSPPPSKARKDRTRGSDFDDHLRDVPRVRYLDPSAPVLKVFGRTPVSRRRSIPTYSSDGTVSVVPFDANSHSPSPTFGRSIEMRPTPTTPRPTTRRRTYKLGRPRPCRFKF